MMAPQDYWPSSSIRQLQGSSTHMLSAESVKPYQSGLDYHIVSIMRTCYETVIVLRRCCSDSRFLYWTDFKPRTLVGDSLDNVSSSCTIFFAFASSNGAGYYMQLFLVLTYISACSWRNNFQTGVYECEELSVTSPDTIGEWTFS